MIKKILACALGLLLVIGLLPPTTVKADDSIYSATSATTLAELKGVIEGTVTNGAGAKYSGVDFATGTYTIKDASGILQLNFDRSFTLNVPSGADVTLEASLQFNNAAEGTFTFNGPGKLTLDGKSTGVNQGINGRSAAKTYFKITNLDFTIKNYIGFAYYSLTDTTVPVYTTVSGGKFTLTNCGQKGEGGIDYEQCTLEFTDGCVVTINECGTQTAEGFGPIYIGFAELVFSAGTKATITNSHGANNVLVINGQSAVNSYGGTGALTITGSGTEVVINNNGTNTMKARGINGANPSLPNVIVTDNGSLTINTTNSIAKDISGIRNSNCEVTNGGKIEINDTLTAFNNVKIKSDTKSVITVDSMPTDIGGTSKPANVEGGSVLVQADVSYIDGVENIVPSKIDPTITNFQGETLSRFDISGLSNTNISISADPNNAASKAYTYEVGANQNGTAYVWAPAVCINFYGNKNKDPNELIDSRYMIRGNNLTLVNGDISRIEGGITVPSGQMIVWKNCDDDSVVDVMNDKLNTCIDVYYEFADIPPVVVNTADNSSNAYFVLLTFMSVAIVGYVICIKRRYLSK